MRAAEMSVVEFRTKVHAHLHAALGCVPSTVPQDVVTDPVAEPLMKQIEALTDLLYSLGSEERDREHAERNRELRIEAKRRNPGLEELAMDLDAKVQHAMVVLGSSAVNVISPMDADLCVSAFVRFLEAFPAAAFSQKRPHDFPSTKDPAAAFSQKRPHDFPSTKDLTVCSIIAAMRIRKEHQK